MKSEGIILGNRRYKEIRKRRRISMGRQQSSLYERKNICSKQPKNMRANPTEKPQTNKYKTSRTTKNA